MSTVVQRELIADVRRKIRPWYDYPRAGMIDSVKSGEGRF